MSKVYIVAGKRTPIGKFGGTLKEISPVTLGAHVMQATLEEAGIPGEDLDLYIFGNVVRAGHGQLVPRQAAIQAGIPQSIDGYAIDMVCSSGMMAVMNAANAIKAGEADLILAGGMESMSQSGFFLSARARWGYKYLQGKPEELKDVLLYDGLTDPIEDAAMGNETDRLSAEYTITREEVDHVAFLSQSRAAAATENGSFGAEIAPMTIKTRKGSIVFNTDEGIRPETTPDSLAKLRPAFESDGILTAGNSSQISDGAAALLIASEAAVEKHGFTPLAEYHTATVSAVDSWRFAEAPVPAVRKLLAKKDLTVEDISLFENNEAFATNSVLFNKELGIPYEKLNIYGGGISLGHPIGCTGARLILTLTHALHQTDGRFGIASLCHGTGGGTAVLIERI